MSRWAVPLILGTFALASLLAVPVGDPFKGGDETRHVMTGVFFRDALFDAPDSLRDPKGYASRYYAQYPALGLLVWPPFFHMAEGLAMAGLGTGPWAARLTVLAFALFGGCYAYRLAALTHGPAVGRLALALFLAAPMAFDFSAYALAEIPCLALILASVYYFERYLAGMRGRDAILACLFAALAALTRYNGVLVLPYALLRLAQTRNWKLLLRRPVAAGLILAVALVLPYYLLALKEYGGGIRDAAVHGTNAERTGFLDARNFWYYPKHLPEQAGWPVAVLGVVGLLAAMRTDRARSGPFLALAAATYVMSVPFAEPVPRHAIYWLPAFAFFAASALGRLRAARPRLGSAAILAVLGWTGYDAVAHTGWYVRGHEAAAEHVARHASGTRPVMIDSELNGAFIYRLRRADPERRLRVVRADKLLYAVLSDPNGRYEEYAATDADVLALIHRYDPEFIVVEQPLMLFDLPPAAALRRVLAGHPEMFRLDAVVHYDSNHHLFKNARLEVYRKLVRNPDAQPPPAVPVLGLGRKVGE